MKLSTADQRLWAADMAEVACEWYEKLASNLTGAAPSPTNVMLVFTPIGRLIAWSATFPNKSVIAKIDAWDTAVLADAIADFAAVERYIQAHTNCKRYYMMHTGDGDERQYVPFSIAR